MESVFEIGHQSFDFVQNSPYSKILRKIDENYTLLIVELMRQFENFPYADIRKGPIERYLTS